MLYTNKKYSQDTALSINSKCIKRVNVTKILGVFIEDELNWIRHISYTSNKLWKCIFILHRIKHILRETSLRILHRSNFLPMCHIVLVSA